MPANLTPDYEKAEQRLREASDDAEKLEALREMLRTIPKHKGTEKMQADIKRRISQMSKAAAKKTHAKGFDPFHVPKGGAGQVVLVGPPNSGKSMLVAATTKAAVKVADHPFATATPLPGMWNYQDVQIELVDTPPMTPEHVPPGLLGTIRAADVVCVVVDAATEPLEQAEMTLNLLAEKDISLASIPRNELPADDRGRMCGIIAATKIDVAPRENVAVLEELYGERIEVRPISSLSGEGLDTLAERLWRLLAMVRVYTKQRGKPPDLGRPFTLPIGSTVEDLAREIHRELPEKMKFARIWGDGRFNGQQIHRTEPLRDKDVVEIHE